MKKQILLAVLLSVVCLVGVQGQSWVKYYLPDSAAIYRPFQMLATSDSAYLLFGDFSSTNARSFTMKIDERGSVLNLNKIYSPVSLRTIHELATKDFLMMGYDTLNRFEAFLLDKKGDFKQRLSVTNLPFRYIIGSIQFNITRTNDSTFALFEANNDSIAITIFDPIRNRVYNKRFIERRPTSMHIEAIQGGYACLFNINNQLTIVKTNVQGDVTGRRSYPITNLLSAFGGYVKSFADRQNNLYIMNETDIYKIGSNGDFLWRRNTLNKFVNNSNDTFSTRNVGLSILRNGQLIVL